MLTFVFVLISFIHMHGAVGGDVCLKFDVQDQGDGTIVEVDGQGGVGDLEN